MTTEPCFVVVRAPRAVGRDAVLVMAPCLQNEGFNLILTPFELDLVDLFFPVLATSLGQFLDFREESLRPKRSRHL